MLGAARAANKGTAHWMVVVDGRGPVHDAVQLVEIVRLSWRGAEQGDDPSRIGRIHGEKQACTLRMQAALESCQGLGSRAHQSGHSKHKLGRDAR